ncbi:hypothetical protein FRB99_005626 [Tulasnella sp. 403]|nr:hypothetical protein FRB99_005626 [Tulasnella sp. 403]
MAPPRTIQELASVATIDTYDPSRSLKDQLRAAEHLRQQSKAFARQDDIEHAFVTAARAATLILDRIPYHSQYHTLTSTQRENLASNGHDLLQILEQLKPRINDRYEQWLAAGGDEAAEREDEDKREYERQQQEEEQERRERRRLAAEEQARLQDEDLYRRRDAEDRERNYRRRQEDRGRDSTSDSIRSIRDQAKAAKARQLEEYHKASRVRDEEIRAQRRQKEEQVFYDVHTAAGYDYVPRSEREWDRDSGRSPPGSVAGPRPMPQTSTRNGYPTPTSITYVTPPRRDDLDFSSPGPLPLESPDRNQHREPYEYGDPEEENGSRNPSRRPSYPPPRTTTSPGSPYDSIEYPRLMSQHQLQQGYTPSTTSMFMGPLTADPMIYYSQSPPQIGAYPILTHSPSGGPSTPSRYPLLPTPSSIPYPYYGQTPLTRVPSIPAVPYLAQPRHSTPKRQNSTSSRSGRESAPPRPPKVPITPPRVPTQADSPASPEGQEEISPAGLRTVWLPSDTLHKFIKIAAINTEMKRETCGLLLGRKKHGAFTVKTLLVPRQTSDENSCTMIEEEMVFDFQEKRELLTLGWIHTHPTQSCFMSSLDLHTHSAFQAMLPEAFAIVCAPKSEPSFGIFRLTDPPGLQIIMSCENKSAFHPHPDQPIYTDADNGHVRMADLPLEISDLRSNDY